MFQHAGLPMLSQSVCAYCAWGFIRTTRGTNFSDRRSPGAFTHRLPDRAAAGTGLWWISSASAGQQPPRSAGIRPSPPGKASVSRAPLAADDTSPVKEPTHAKFRPGWLASARRFVLPPLSSPTSRRKSDFRWSPFNNKTTTGRAYTRLPVAASNIKQWNYIYICKIIYIFSPSIYIISLFYFMYIYIYLFFFSLFYIYSHCARMYVYVSRTPLNIYALILPTGIVDTALLVLL